jgi:hypothetical protein
MACNKLTPWSSVLLDNPPVAQLFKNLPTFYGTPRLVACPQESSVGPYPEPDETIYITQL